LLDKNLSLKPLIIRFSNFFGNGLDLGSGYHIDCRKSLAAIKQLLADYNFLTAVLSRNSSMVRDSLPIDFLPLKALADWSRRKPIFPDHGVMHENSVKFYHYIDVEGIDILFPQAEKTHRQIGIRVDTETIDEITAQQMADILDKTGITAITQGEHYQEVSIESIKRPEEKLKIIIQTLTSNGDSTFLNLEHCNISDISNKPFAEFIGWFNTKDFKRVYEMSYKDVLHAKLIHHALPIEVGTSLRKFQMGLHHVFDFLGCTERDITPVVKDLCSICI
jgi:hypothetical protein